MVKEQQLNKSVVHADLIKIYIEYTFRYPNILISMIRYTFQSFHVFQFLLDLSFIFLRFNNFLPLTLHTLTWFQLYINFNLLYNAISMSMKRCVNHNCQCACAWWCRKSEIEKWGKKKFSQTFPINHATNFCICIDRSQVPQQHNLQEIICQKKKKEKSYVL